MGFKLSRLKKQFKGISKIAKPIFKPVQRAMDKIVRSVPIIGGVYGAAVDIAKPILSEKRKATTLARRQRHQLERDTSLENALLEEPEGALEAQVMGRIPQRMMFSNRGDLGSMGGGMLDPRLFQQHMNRGGFAGGQQRMTQTMTPASFMQMRRRVSPGPQGSPAAPPAQRRFFSSGRFFR